MDYSQLSGAVSDILYALGVGLGTGAAAYLVKYVKTNNPLTGDSTTYSTTSTAVKAVVLPGNEEGRDKTVKIYLSAEAAQASPGDSVVIGSQSFQIISVKTYDPAQAVPVLVEVEAKVE